MAKVLLMYGVILPETSIISDLIIKVLYIFSLLHPVEKQERPL